MKRLILAFSLVACLASAGLAQVVEDPSKYTSGAPAPETPLVNVNRVASNEPIFSVSLHPVSLALYPLIMDYLPLYLTIEGNINSNASIITRPFFKSKSWSDKDDNRNDTDIDVYVIGLSEGFRYYFFRGHQGFYTSIHGMFEYVSIKHEYEDRKSRNAHETGNSLSLAFYVGSKNIWGHFTTSFDIGATYTNTFVNRKYKDDLEEISSVGIDFDLNYTVGFTF